MKENDRNLIIKDPWIHLILSGRKTIEVRGTPYRPGHYCIGNNQLIRGEIVLGTAKHVPTESDWNFLRPRHCVSSTALPYAKTYALPILSARRVGPTPFVHPRGAINIVKYRRA